MKRNVFKDAAVKIRAGMGKKIGLRDYWNIGDVLLNLMLLTQDVMAETEALTRLSEELGTGFSKSTLQYCLLYRRRFSTTKEFELTFDGLKWSYIVDLAAVHDVSILQKIARKAREAEHNKVKDLRSEIRRLALELAITGPAPTPESEKAVVRLRAFRKTQRMSQARISEISGVDKKTLSDIERQMYAPPLDVVRRLFKATGLEEFKALLPRKSLRA